MADLRNRLAVSRTVTTGSESPRITWAPGGPSRGKGRKRYAVLVLGTYTDEELAELNLEEVMAELGWRRFKRQGGDCGI